MRQYLIPEVVVMYDKYYCFTSTFHSYLNFIVVMRLSVLHLSESSGKSEYKVHFTVISKKFLKEKIYRE